MYEILTSSDSLSSTNHMHLQLQWNLSMVATQSTDSVIEGWSDYTVGPQMYNLGHTCLVYSYKDLGVCDSTGVTMHALSNLELSPNWDKSPGREPNKDS